MISPPYTTEFVQAFLPLIESEDITGILRHDDENDLVSEFIGRFENKGTKNLESTPLGEGKLLGLQIMLNVVFATLI